MAQTGIRLTRLACLYAILFYLATETALTLREIGEANPRGGIPAQIEDPISFLGVTVALEQYEDSIERQEALRRLSEAGFGWVRQRVDWGRTEPRPGAYNWTWSDQVLADVAAAGLEPVVVLDGSPPWARGSVDRTVEDEDQAANTARLAQQLQQFAPPAATKTYAAFASAFAVRYKDSVRYYQIWNEPNIAPHWGNRHIDPVGYARLLKSAAIAVRAADPDAVILAAALAPTRDRGHTAIDEGYFLQRLYAAGAAPYFDVVLVQPFGFGTGPDDQRSRVDVLNFRRTAWVRRVMVAAGDEQTPIWAVRFGWNRNTQARWQTVSAANQARFSQEAIRYARASWTWLTAMGWPVDRPHTPLSDPLWGFALVNVEGQEDPLLKAFESANGAAGGTTPDESRDMGRTVLYARLALLLLAVGILFVRGRLILRDLPLARWQVSYRRWPQVGKLVAWAVLLVIYYFASWPPLIVLCWLAAAFLIAAQPLTGLMLTAALLPFHFQHKELRLVETVWTVSPAQAALLATLPGLALRVGYTNLQRITRMLNAIRQTLFTDRLVLAWIGISLLTALNVWHWPGYVHGFWALVAVPVLLYAGIRILAVKPRHRRAVLKALFAGGAVAACAGILDWLFGGGVSVDGVRRLMGISFSPNQTALYLLRTLLIGAGLLTIKGPGRSAIAAGSLLAASALALTLSRGAFFLGLPAGTLVMIAAGGERVFGRWRLHLRLLMGLLALAVVVPLLFLYGERILNIETLQTRFAIWRDAWSLWTESPLLGVGPGGFFWNYPAFMQPSPSSDPNLLHPHSVWLEYATGWGVVGLAWLAALLGWMLYQLNRLRRGPIAWVQVGLLAALSAGLAHAQADAFAMLPELAAWNFVAMALLASEEAWDSQR